MGTRAINIVVLSRSEALNRIRAICSCCEHSDLSGLQALTDEPGIAWNDHMIDLLLQQVLILPFFRMSPESVVVVKERDTAC